MGQDVHSLVSEIITQGMLVTRPTIQEEEVQQGSGWHIRGREKRI